MLDNLKRDLPSSIVVFFVAVPLCLGIALASGAPPITGLFAGIIGGILVGAASGSPLGVSGPAAGLVTIVSAAIADLGGFEYFLVALVLAGGIQIALGYAKAGVIAYFFPSSVIKGMLAGIGIIIILKQIPHALGYDADPEGDLSFQQPDDETTLEALGSMLQNLDHNAILVAGVSLFLLLFWDTVLSKKSKFFRVIQGPLVAVAFGIAYQAYTSRYAPDFALAKSHLVNVPVAANLTEFAQNFRAPSWDALSNFKVYVTAFTLAVVASLETLLCVEATDKLDPQKRVTPTNRELIAQGMGNISSGLIGGLPVTQVIVRSSANIQSGGRTKASAILHGIFILIAVVALPEVLNLVPLAVLASVLLVVGFKLAKPASFVAMFKRGWPQFVPFIVTILGIVFTDLLTGIALGMAVAIVIILRRNLMNSHFLHLKESDTPEGRHVYNITLSEEVTFLNKGAVLRALSKIPAGSDIKIDASQSFYVDEDVEEIIEEFSTTAANKDINIDYQRPQGQSKPSY